MDDLNVFSLSGRSELLLAEQLPLRSIHVEQRHEGALEILILVGIGKWASLFRVCQLVDRGGGEGWVVEARR